MRALGWVYWSLAARVRDTVDHVAVNWLLKRRNLDRAYIDALLVELAKRTGAKVEYTQTPGG